MHHHIIRQSGVVAVVAVAHTKQALCTLIVNIAGARFVGVQAGVIVPSVPCDFGNAHRGMVDRQTFELAIDVARVEYQRPAMLPGQAIGRLHLGANVDARIVPAAILQHHRLDFPVGLRDVHALIVHRPCYLLMRGIHVDIGVGGAREPGFHRGLGHHETGARHQRVLLVINAHLVVAALRQPALVVGQGKGIMRVGHLRLARGLHVVDGHPLRKAFGIIGGEQLRGRCPVGLAMHHVVGETAIGRREIVE